MPRAALRHNPGLAYSPGFLQRQTNAKKTKKKCKARFFSSKDSLMDTTLARWRKQDFELIWSPFVGVWDGAAIGVS